MSRNISICPQAIADLNTHADYLSQQDTSVGFRFFDAARQTFADLARMPGIGSAYETNNPSLQTLRKWRVKGFEKFLIFYLMEETSIGIVRVLYATQDIQNILQQEE